MDLQTQAQLGTLAETAQGFTVVEQTVEDSTVIGEKWTDDVSGDTCIRCAWNEHSEHQGINGDDLTGVEEYADEWDEYVEDRIELDDWS